MFDYSRFDFLKEVFRWDEEKIKEELSPSFFNYYRRYFNDVLRFKGMIDEADHIIKVTNAAGKKVLDLGCGYGLLLIQMGLLGCKEAVGVDSNEKKISIFKKLLNLLSKEDSNLCKTYPCIGDILKIDYPDNYFDVVIARETISHVRDVDTFFIEVKRVLKKDGIFFIKDGNNALDIYTRFSRRRLWKKHEFGPVAGTGLSKPYRVTRKEMIMERYPDLDSNKLDYLVDKTIGMWGEELYRAVEDFLNKGILTKTPKFKYRNPKTGDYAEVEFNPYYLKNVLNKLGFKAYIIAPFYSYTYSGLKGTFLNAISKTISLFHPLSLLVAPTFEIVANKINTNRLPI